MISPRVFILSAVIPYIVSSKQYIDSRALKIFNNSVLVENIECDSRVDDNECSHFTLFHIYAFAAKVPPSGAGGYITNEPQFACSHVEPPKNSTIEWAALVYYSSMSCDCSYEEKILHLQAAGYKIALLMETSNCSNDIGNDDANVIDITIPAVLLSQTVGLSLLSYSYPTDDAEPIGSVIVEAHYETEVTTIEIIIAVGLPFIVAITVMCFCYCLLLWRRIRRRRQYQVLPKTKPKNLPKPSDDTESEPLELTSQAGHVNIALQKIKSNKQHGKKYGTASGSTTLTSDDAFGPQLKLQVSDNQDDDNKNLLS